MDTEGGEGEGRRNSCLEKQTLLFSGDELFVNCDNIELMGVDPSYSAVRLYKHKYASWVKHSNCRLSLTGAS